MEFCRFSGILFYVNVFFVICVVGGVMLILEIVGVVIVIFLVMYF